MEFLACGLLIATHVSAISGGEELHEEWGTKKDSNAEKDEGTVVGEQQEGGALGKRRSEEV